MNAIVSILDKHHYQMVEDIWAKLERELAVRGMVAHIVKTPKSAQIRATFLLFNNLVFFKMDDVHA